MTPIIKAMRDAGLLKEAVARVQVYNDEGSTTVIHEFRLYANDGTALILHYDVGS